MFGLRLRFTLFSYEVLDHNYNNLGVKKISNKKNN